MFVLFMQPLFSVCVYVSFNQPTHIILLKMKRKRSEKFGFEPYKLRNYWTFNWVVYFFKNKKKIKEKKTKENWREKFLVRVHKKLWNNQWEIKYKKEKDCVFIWKLISIRKFKDKSGFQLWEMVRWWDILTSSLFCFSEVTVLRKYSL